MRKQLIILAMLIGSIAPAMAQVSVSIGINLPVYPQLVAVPGYPVYYAPQVNSNYFFYDGMYWVYQDDNWYASTWYNGPWGLVAPDVVPLYVLRVPVRYYRRPPVYFGGWRADAPPRWGEHWGNSWEQRRVGWDRWNRDAIPAPAPLPVYQRQYSGNRYPRAEQQQVLQSQNYRYQPRDTAVQQQYQAQRGQGGSQAAPSQRPQTREPMPQAQPRQMAQPGQPQGQQQPQVQPPRQVSQPQQQAQPQRQMNASPQQQTQSPRQTTQPQQQAQPQRQMSQPPPQQAQPQRAQPQRQQAPPAPGEAPPRAQGPDKGPQAGRGTPESRHAEDSKAGRDSG